MSVIDGKDKLNLSFYQKNYPKNYLMCKTFILFCLTIPVKAHAGLSYAKCLQHRQFCSIYP